MSSSKQIRAKKTGCKLNPSTSRCHAYAGEDKMGCTMGPNGCRLTTALQKAYTPKRQATPAQLAALAKGRAVRAANKAAPQNGGGCKLSPKTNRCRKVGKGPDVAPCVQGPNRCRLAKNLKRAYNVSKQATPAQLAALKRARDARAAKVQSGGYWF